jgi:hypothetical protein
MTERPEAETDFVPTAAMLRFARACVTAAVEPQDVARCAAAEISVRALERWRTDPRFCDWLRLEIQRQLSAEIWEIWSVVNRLARQGNLQAAKVFLERFDPSAVVAPSAPDTFRALADLATQAAVEAEKDAL